MNVLHEKRFAIIGAGNIGTILLKQLQAAGIPPEHLTVCDSDPVKAQAAETRFGVQVGTLSDPCIYGADVLLLSASPMAITGIVQAVAGCLKPGQVIISFAAAVPISHLEALVPPEVSLIRIMPNAPSLVGKGMNPVVYGSAASLEAQATAKAILELLGDSIELHDDQMNWAVGLSGATMRSLLPVLEGMTRAGIDAGLPENEARRVAAQVMAGTAAMALDTDLSFEQIKALTPMQTVDEAAIAQLFLDAAYAAKGKLDSLQSRLFGETHPVSSEV